MFWLVSCILVSAIGVVGLRMRKVCAGLGFTFHGRTRATWDLR